MKARPTTGLRVVLAILACMVSGAVGSAQEPAPLLQGPVVVEQDVRDESPVSGPGPIHEAIEVPALRTTAAERVDRSPPPPIYERPGTARPAPTAQWVPGYWEWDSARGDFLWVTGVWRVPPPGRSWVNGSWQRDEHGWYRVPGSWSDHRSASAGAGGAAGASGLVSIPPTPAPNSQPSFQRADYDPTRDGPPSEHPEERIGPAPNPNSFYVPGYYEPRGTTVVWHPGFWARSQPGWNWIPAQWIRRPDGWTFQPGFWSRTPASRGPFAPVGPVNTGRNPASNLAAAPASTAASREMSLGSDVPALTANGSTTNPGLPAGGEPGGSAATGYRYQVARPAFDPTGGDPNNRLFDAYYMQNAGSGLGSDPYPIPGLNPLTGRPYGDPAYLPGGPFDPRQDPSNTGRSTSRTRNPAGTNQPAGNRRLPPAPYGYAYDAYGRLYRISPYARPLPGYNYGPGRNPANRAAAFVNRLLNGF
jgi:hypothetical protein